MSFAKSFYADQKKAEQPQQPQDFAGSPAMPASTPIVEDTTLTPAQIQEAIRIYRSVLSSSSAPPSPVRRPAPAPLPERPQVHSNYYGGGPTDIPQSYLLNYNTTRVTSPQPEQFAEQQLIAQLQALQLQQQQQEAAENVYEAPVVQQAQPAQPKVAPKKAPVLQKMYDDEESGYCFHRVKNDEEESPEVHVATPTFQAPPAQQAPAPINYSPAPVPNSYSKVISGPSEYIGMNNDCRFIYDSQKAPVSYAQNNSYTLVNAAPVPPVLVQEREDQGMTTEDITQVPESPAVTSRFRGMIRNAQTPVQATAPIVVERIAKPGAQPTYNNYGAFMPVNNQMSMESEYQLPVLNDLASCIEHY